MIRKMNETDIKQVMKIWLDANVEAHDFIHPDYWQNHVEDVAQMLPQAHVQVYEEKQEILGFIGMDEQYIAGIFVMDKARSKGIGKQLLDDVKTKEDTLVLHVYEKNQKAVQFYKREGFCIVEKHVDTNTGEQEYKMQWKKAC